MWQEMYDRVRRPRTKTTQPGHFVNDHPSGRAGGVECPVPPLFRVKDTHSVHADALAARGICAGTPADFDKAVAGATIVVTVRHPDFDNETTVFGNPVTAIDIDLGRGFDVSRIGREDFDDILDWACSLYDEADQLPKTAAGLEARAFVRSVADDTLSQCLTFDEAGYGQGGLNAAVIIGRERNRRHQLRHTR